MQTNPWRRKACVCVCMEFGHAHESGKKLNTKTMIKIKRYKKNEQDRGEEDSVWSCSSGTLTPGQCYSFSCCLSLEQLGSGGARTLFEHQVVFWSPKICSRMVWACDQRLFLDVFRVFVLFLSKLGWNQDERLLLRISRRKRAKSQRKDRSWMWIL